MPTRTAEQNDRRDSYMPLLEKIVLANPSITSPELENNKEWARKFGINSPNPIKPYKGMASIRKRHGLPMVNPSRKNRRPVLEAYSTVGKTIETSNSRQEDKMRAIAEQLFGRSLKATIAFFDEVAAEFDTLGNVRKTIARIVERRERDKLWKD